MPPPTPHPIFNTTYTLHRVSPLHAFPSLTHTALAPHARSLLHLLRGDTFRNVPIGAPTNTLTRAGKLLTVTWTPLTTAPKGVHISLNYESATYTALLLGRSPTRLPLLATRMPRPLQAALTEYLARTFDAHVSGLAVPSARLHALLDAYLAATDGGGEAKDVVLSFLAGEKGVRELTVTVGGGEVVEFWARGADDGFLGAVGKHLEAACGLVLDEVALVKVVCGGFVVGGEKAKVWWDEAVDALVEEAEA